MKYQKLLILFLGAFVLGSCDPEEQVTDITQFPRMKVENQSVLENIGTANVSVELTWAYTQEVTVEYEIMVAENGEAESGQDFEGQTGKLTFPVGSLTADISVTIIDDVISEPNEKFQVVLSNPVYGKLLNSTAIITIENDDSSLNVDGSGYEAPELYQGYLRAWEEDFSAGAIDASIWTHEIGGNGWGNSELQYYTDKPTNSFQAAGYLFIEAKEQTIGSNDYTSARLISQDKFEFEYGRVDIRAKLPKGKGLWPALWMLGHDFGEVGWPRCGEIDIMELIGSSPKIVHGTAHYFGDNNSHQFQGGSTFLSGGGDYSDAFHVYSIIWRENYIEWQVDGKKFHTLTPSDIEGEWPFNDEFFFILNVAVGGQWPGNPDASTIFPQQMLVDYIRLYQLV